MKTERQIKTRMKDLTGRCKGAKQPNIKMSIGYRRSWKAALRWVLDE